MTKARRLISEAMPSQDVIIEVLDARLPRSSENPLLTELRRHKPCIKVLAKSDLADPAVTSSWIRFLQEENPPSPGDGVQPGAVVAMAISMDRPGDIQRLPELCRKLALCPRGANKAPRAMIVGVPNVGKSTLINTLLGRKVAKVGDKPAVTKGQQVVTLKDGLVVSDNPGITWPKFEDEDASLRLAFAGSLPDTAIDFERVATWGADYLLRHYPDELTARFRLNTLPADARALLVEIGKRRGGFACRWHRPHSSSGRRAHSRVPSGHDRANQPGDTSARLNLRSGCRHPSDLRRRSLRTFVPVRARRASTWQRRRARSPHLHAAGVHFGALHPLTQRGLRQIEIRRHLPSQYASGDYRDALTTLGLTCSMSRKGNCWDNAVAESFFATLKTELVYLRRFATRAEAREAIFDFIEVFYNRQRRHSTLGFISPVEFEKKFHQDLQQAA